MNVVENLPPYSFQFFLLLAAIMGVFLLLSKKFRSSKMVWLFLILGVVTWIIVFYFFISISINYG